MNQQEAEEQFQGLPLKLAYAFLSDRGFGTKVEEIRQSKEQYKSYTSSLRRGKIVDLLQANHLLAEFIEQHWPFGKTEKGRRKIQRYRRIYDSFLTEKEKDEQEEEDEKIEETSFAYEEDLRDYLSSNLSIIEPGLKLYKDEKSTEGIEYPVDAENRKLDILAVDSESIPVIIELKVSRGYEKVVGQCLYYKARVKQLLQSPKVRIVVIAREITPQLKAATEELPDVQLFEYKLSVRLDKIT